MRIPIGRAYKIGNEAFRRVAADAAEKFFSGDGGELARIPIVPLAPCHMSFFSWEWKIRKNLFFHHLAPQINVCRSRHRPEAVLYVAPWKVDNVRGNSIPAGKCKPDNVVRFRHGAHNESVRVACFNNPDAFRKMKEVFLSFVHEPRKKRAHGIQDYAQ